MSGYPTFTSNRQPSTFPYAGVSCGPGSTPPAVRQGQGFVAAESRFGPPPMPSNGATNQFPNALTSSLTLRTRREINTHDTTNTRYYGTMDIGVRPPLRPFMDEAPIASRVVSGSQYKASPDFFERAIGGQPATASSGTSTPGITGNPYLGRMDIAQDPRNAVREARSAFSEDNTDADVYLNNRFMSREGVTRFIPASAPDAHVLKPGEKGPVDHTLAAYDQLRAQNSSYIRVDPKTRLYK